MFDWDWEDGNTDHVRDHGVDLEETEEAYLDRDRIRAEAYAVGNERRFAWIGKSVAGRVLFMVTVLREGRVRIITARDAADAEKRRYRRRGE